MGTQTPVSPGLGDRLFLCLLQTPRLTDQSHLLGPLGPVLQRQSQVGQQRLMPGAWAEPRGGLPCPGSSPRTSLHCVGRWGAARSPREGSVFLTITATAPGACKQLALCVSGQHQSPEG